MSDTLTAVIAIALAAILMFVFPLMTMADRTDDVTQLAVETATKEFVDSVRTGGKITEDSLAKYEETITGPNTYDIEIEIQKLDENPGKKTTQVKRDAIGENHYSSIFKTQLEDYFETTSKTYNLNEGDIISVTVRNNNLTLAQQLKNLFYKVVGKDTATIVASHGGIVTATGTNNN